MQCDSPACTSFDAITGISDNAENRKTQKRSQEQDDVSQKLGRQPESPRDAVYGLSLTASTETPTHFEAFIHSGSADHDITLNNDNTRTSKSHSTISNPVRHNSLVNKNNRELSRDISERPSSVTSFIRPTTIASTRTSFSSSDIYGCRKCSIVNVAEKDSASGTPEETDFRPRAFKQMLAPRYTTADNNAISIVSSSSISSSDMLSNQQLNDTNRQQSPEQNSIYSSNFHTNVTFEPTCSKESTQREIKSKKELNSNKDFESSPCSCSINNAIATTSKCYTSPIMINTSIDNTYTVIPEKNFANASTSPPNFRNFPSPIVTVSSDSRRHYIKHDNTSTRAKEINEGLLSYNSTTGYVKKNTVNYNNYGNYSSAELENNKGAGPASQIRNGREGFNNDLIASDMQRSSQIGEGLSRAYSPSLKYSTSISGTTGEVENWADDQSGQQSNDHHAHHHAHFRTADGQPMDLEDVLLLQTPILPPNSHFFCCFYKFHITAVAKVLSVMYAFFYGFLCVLSYKSQHAAAFLIAVLVTFSVGASTLYATFKWSKLCLIPFFLLQIMLVLYALICFALLVYAEIVGPYSYTFREFQMYLDGFLQLSTKSWILLILFGLIVLMLLFCYSALLLWYEYQFIAEVDRFLKSIRKTSSQASRDDIQTQNGANFNSKNAF